jgi:hypothetical protein
MIVRCFAGTKAVFMDASEKMDVNAVWLRNAVLCADCEVITDSPHDSCGVCGSRSLLSLSSALGGALPVQRARIVQVWESTPELADFSPKRRLPHKRARRLLA